MSSTSHQVEIERIEDEAAIWAARLRGGGMTDADRARLAAWLERDPEHRCVLGRYRELCAGLDEQFGSVTETTAQPGGRPADGGCGVRA
jgi:ferric-dicitrate binding protein FerR (iron transport regulator)